MGEAELSGHWHIDMSAQKEKRAGRFNEKRRAPPSLAGSGQTEPQCEGLTAKLAGRPLFIPSKGKIWRHFALGTRARKTMQYSELETKDLSMAATVSPQTLPAHGFFQALARNGVQFCWPVYYHIPSEAKARMQQFVILFQEVLRGWAGRGDLKQWRRMARIFL